MACRWAGAERGAWGEGHVKRGDVDRQGMPGNSCASTVAQRS